MKWLKLRFSLVKIVIPVAERSHSALVVFVHELHVTSVHIHGPAHDKWVVPVNPDYYCTCEP